MDEYHLTPDQVNRMTFYQLQIYTCDSKWLQVVSLGKGPTGIAGQIVEESQRATRSLMDELLERAGCQLH